MLAALWKRSSFQRKRLRLRCALCEVNVKSMESRFNRSTRRTPSFLQSRIQFHRARFSASKSSSNPVVFRFKAFLENPNQWKQLQPRSSVHRNTRRLHAELDEAICMDSSSFAVPRQHTASRSVLLTFVQKKPSTTLFSFRLKRCMFTFSSLSLSAYIVESFVS